MFLFDSRLMSISLRTLIQPVYAEGTVEQLQTVDKRIHAEQSNSKYRNNADSNAICFVFGEFLSCVAYISQSREILNRCSDVSTKQFHELLGCSEL